MTERDLPTGWASKTIGDLATLVRGVTYQRAQARGHPIADHLGLLRATNLVDGRVTDDDLVYVPTSVVSADQHLRVGDYLLATSSGSATVVGKGGPVSNERYSAFTFGAFCAALRPTNLVIPEYLHLLASSPLVRDAWSSAARGTNINNLKPSDILNTPAALPPVAEQRAIVDILEDHLSRLDAAVSAIASASLKASELRLRVIEDTVSGRWSERPLGDVVSLRNGVFVSRPADRPPGTPIFRISAVRPLELAADDIRYADKAESEVDGYFVSEGDLLLTRYSGNPRFVGACAVVGALRSPVLHPDKLIRGRVDRSVADPWFLAAYLTASEGRGQVEARLKTTAGQVGIAGGQLKTITVPLPPLDEQRRRVVEMHRSLDLLKVSTAAIGNATRLASGVRRALLIAAFRGDLTRAWRERHG